MAFNVSDFRAQMQGDGARPSIFSVEINLPANLQALNIGNRFSTKLKFTARAAQLPGSDIGFVETHYYGRPVNFAGNRTFQEWTVTILNDEDFVTRSVLERWSAAINSHEANLRRQDLLNPNEYTADIYIRQESKSGGILYSYQLFYAFPTSIAPIELDWGAVDQIEEYAATFKFDYWKSEAPDGSGVSD